MKFKVFLSILLVSLATASFVFSQSSELAATLEVLTGVVEVKRVNTANWIPVKVEAIVGVGDVIRTNESGQARVTFFVDGVDTDILENSEFEIVTFSGQGESFNLEVSVVVGQTIQRLGRVLDANSSYDVNTPGMTLAARGTEFAIRVEDTGRSGMLVREGTVDAASDGSDADVPANYGIRAAVDETLSDVVLASTFEQLDAALDGCPVSVTTIDDVRLNVRISPSVDAFRVGTVAADTIDLFYGVSASGSWYRIMFNDGYGWILSSAVKVDTSCAGLRVFADDHMEDIDTYGSFGEVIDPASYVAPTQSDEADAEATEEAPASDGA